jgi:RHS repeat-associated protein
MTTTKTYDLLNRLTAIQSSAGVSPAASFNYNYNTANQRTQRTEADSSYWVYQYDALGQVISGKRYWSDGTPVAGQQFTYNFDDIGNRKSTAAGGDASGNNLRSANYAANNLNQYTSRDVPGYATVLGSANANATVTVNLQRAYRYGNYFQDELSVDNSSAALWLSLTNLAVLNNGTNADIVATNTGNVLLPQTPETFGYDADGDMTNSGRWTITWDAENRATSFTSLSSAPAASKKQVNCAYDYQGRRIQKIVSTWNGSAYVAQSTNRFVYDGWNLVAEVKPDNSKIRTYMWGSDLSGSLQGAGGVGGLLEVSYYGTGGTTNCFPAFDGNGNVAALINAADGTVAANYEYAAFGEPIRITGVMAKNNPFRFSTKYADDESDLLYYGFRYYKPSTGTWPNRDPLQEKGGMNLYGFGNNDAVNQFDALGLEIKVSQNDDGSWDVEGDHGWSDSIKPGGGTRTSPTYTFETPRTVKSSILGYYGITANQSVSVKLLQIPQSQCTAYKSTPIIPSMPHVSVQWWPPPPTPTVTVGMTFGESGSDSVSVSYTDYLIFSEYTAAGSYQGKSRIWAKCACAEIETDASIKRDVFVNKGTVALYGVVAYAIAEAWGTEATLAALGKLVLATK